MNLKHYQDQLNIKKGELSKLNSQLKDNKQKLTANKIDLDNIQEAQEIIQAVAKLTQEQIKIHISDIVNLALQSIPFEEVVEFGLDFVVRRNSTECDLFFIQDENRINPIDGSGGGVLDVASFGLLLALWSLKVGKKNNTIILDECFKFLSVDLREYVSDMLQSVCDKLGIQLIMVSHDPTFLESATTIHKVEKINGISKVVKL